MTMKASQFSDARKAFILKQGNEVPVAEICGKSRYQPGDLFQQEEEVQQTTVADRDAAAEAPSTGVEWASRLSKQTDRCDMEKQSDHLASHPAHRDPGERQKETSVRSRRRLQDTAPLSFHHV